LNHSHIATLGTLLGEKTNKAFFALLVFCVLIAAALMAPVANAELSIQLNPNQGPVGTIVGVYGVGFGSGTVTIALDSTTVTRVYPGMFGRINGVFSIPSVSLGDHTVTVTTASGAEATATFTVTQGSAASLSGSTAATLWLGSFQGTVGSTVTVTGSGFGVGNSVSINFGTIHVTTTNTDSFGGINAAFTVPLVATGTYIITATGGGTSATQSFTVNQAGSQILSTGLNGIPITTPTAANAEFWSTPTIILIVLVVAAAIVVSLALFRRRQNKQETLFEEEERSQYKPAAPVPPKRPAVTPAYKHGSIASRYDQFASYGKPASYAQQPSKNQSVASRYTQATTYSSIQRKTTAAATAPYNSSARYNLQPAKTTICRHCKRSVREDYSVCPFCRKRIK
jgi:hypothetical protein